MKTLCLLLLSWGLARSGVALAQEQGGRSIDEIQRLCEEYAQADAVPADEYDEYMADCIELELDSDAAETEEDSD